MAALNPAPDEASAGAPATAGLRRRLIVDAVALALWVGVAAWASYALATYWPYELLPQLLVLVLALPGAIFRGVDLFYTRRSWRLLAGWRRFGLRVLALLVGMSAALALHDGLRSLSWTRFERAMAGFVDQVVTQAGAPCPPAASYPLTPALRAYFVQARALTRGELHHRGGRFVLIFHGYSIDIDGSTVYYDSAAPGWQQFHNDNREQASALTARVEGMASCRFDLR